MATDRSDRDVALGLDIGGTKLLASLVAGNAVLETRTLATPRAGGAAAWCDAVAAMVADWRGRYACAGAAVSGRVADGAWFALNPATLPITAGFPLVATLQQALRVPVLACNDAQAAAWGEFRHGAGRASRSLVFVTVSTGLGGGAVIDGRLLMGRGGLAGHIGQIRLAAADRATRLEELVAGLAIARQAREAGHDDDAAAVCDAAERGEDWAEAILWRSADLLATALADLQLLFDPEVTVVGGGIGLRPSYAARVQRALQTVPAVWRPAMLPAMLGVQAGVIGVADLAREAAS